MMMMRSKSISIGDLNPLMYIRATNHRARSMLLAAFYTYYGRGTEQQQSDQQVAHTGRRFCWNNGRKTMVCDVYQIDRLRSTELVASKGIIIRPTVTIGHLQFSSHDHAALRT